MQHSKIRSAICLASLFFAAMTSGDAFGQFPTPLDTIRQTTVAPYGEICFLRVERKRLIGSSHFVSTGFFIAPNVVLTAAHNIHSAFNSKVVSIEIIPGKNFTEGPVGSLVISGRDDCEEAIRRHPTYSFSDVWTTRVERDFGVIIIPDAALASNPSIRGGKAFTLDRGLVAGVGDTLHVAGYPADPDKGYNGDFITTQQDTCASVSGKTLQHRLETQRGNSGSPIWVERDGRRVIVGVHTFSNTATKLDPENLDMILRWVEQAKPRK